MHPPVIKFLSRLCAGSGLLLVPACATVPDLGQAPVSRAAGSIAASETLAGSGSAAWPAEGSWRGLGDAQLDALIDEGLRNSPDVAAAAARFHRAHAMAQQAGAAALPSLDAQGGISLEKRSYNNGFPKEFLPKGWQDNGQIAAVLAYDIDVWGRNRAGLAAATSEARAAAVDARQARLLLATGIASSYAELQRLFEEREVRQAMATARAASLQLVTQRYRAGLDTRGSSSLAQAQAAAARGDVAASEQEIALRRYQIAALIGAGPDRGLAIVRPSLASSPVPGLPADVTTELLGRRPDIVAARERVEAAASRIKVARADFYPAIRINALAGLQALGLGNLVRSDSTYGNVGPAISLPLFHGGALQGQYRGVRASYDEAVAGYDRTVLAAYQQVADAVTSQRQLMLRLGEARAALAASEDAHAIAGKRYRAGLSTYLDVLSVEDRLLQAKLMLSMLEAAGRTADIALVRALGGGFSAGEGAAQRKDIRHD